MIKKIAWEFEKIDECNYRAKVIGGWILKIFEGKQFQCVFVEDKEHVWIIIKSDAAIEAQQVKPKINPNDYK